MKETLIIAIIFATLFFTCAYLDSKKDPLEVGTHFEYTIKCINGWKYKTVDRGAVMLYDKNFKPIPCNGND